MTDSAQTRWLTDEQQRVWRRWLTVGSRLPAALGRQLQNDSALSLQDFAVLANVSEAPDGRLRVSALSGVLDWEQSRLSHHLNRMEKRGLVTREACDDDRRGSWVSLTDEGRSRLVQAAPGHATAVLELLFDPLDADRLSALDAFLGSILAAIDEHPHGDVSR